MPRPFYGCGIPYHFFEPSAVDVAVTGASGTLTSSNSSWPIACRVYASGSGVGNGERLGQLECVDRRESRSSSQMAVAKANRLKPTTAFLTR